ncbi:MAG TPA: DUF1127 domain-containing protein [Chthoniobacterales bacterium]|nr:DUF1127 domain-containing protein [Chthoniobacterales bacterium]
MSSKKQANRHITESGEAVCDMALASTAASAARLPRDRGSSPISVLKILRWCRTTGERCRQRKQLMEMDYRQLKDIGITPEEAEQEARKPIWKD